MITIPYSPPKKITVILSFLLLALGIYILAEVIFEILPDVFQLFDIGVALPDITNQQAWGAVGIFCVALSWILFFLSINLRGV